MGNGEIRQSQALHSATHTILRPSRGVIERGRRLELGRTPYGRAWLRILAVSDDSAYCYQMHYLLSYSSDIFPSHFRSRLFCTRICSVPTLVLAFLPLFPHCSGFRCISHCSRAHPHHPLIVQYAYLASLSSPSSRPFGPGRVSLGVSTFTPAQRRTTVGQTKQMDWYVAFAVSSLPWNVSVCERGRGSMHGRFSGPIALTSS